MYKLLTEETKMKVAREYSLRRMIVILLALIAVLAIGIIGLMPSYVLSNAKQKEVIERNNVTLNIPQTQEFDTQAWLDEINLQLKTLDPKLDKDRPSIFIERVLEQKIPGIRITGFSWIRSKNQLSLKVDGIASSRRALIDFRDRIDSSGFFSSVELPISDLAQDANINFQISFSYQPEPTS